jgi:FMN phosphatase YigB (HAD superfamily)
MRAWTVSVNAYIFDWDDTLIKSNAKVKVFKNEKLVKVLSPKEYNTYKRSSDEVLDFLDFEKPEHILNAEKYKMWKVLTNIDSARKNGKSKSEIFILTARHPKVKKYIAKFLKREGIDMPLAHIITIGDAKGYIDIAEKKKEILQDFADTYYQVYFFDDDERNISMAKEISGIKTRLIESDI